MESPAVTLAGVSYPVPDLVVDQLRVVFPAIMRWQAALVDPSKFSEANYDDLILAVYHGVVRRNDPKVTLQAFRALTVPHYELMAALEVVQKQTHLFRPALEGEVLGEDKAPTT